jgi:hypothetical protein
VVLVEGAMQILFLQQTEPVLAADLSWFVNGMVIAYLLGVLLNFSAPAT